MRLDKLLGALGVATRSDSKALLRAGRVTVNGETVRDGAASVSEADEIAFDGQDYLFDPELEMAARERGNYLSDYFMMTRLAASNYGRYYRQ